MPQRISLSEIAERTGYHKSTVSLALRGSESIAGTTREKIRRVAREVGYIPDPVMSQIAAHRWKHRSTRRDLEGSSIAFLRPAREHHRFDRAVEEGARAAAAENSFSLTPISLESCRSTACVARILQARGIRGVVFAPGSAGANAADDPLLAPFTRISCSYDRLDTADHTVSFDWGHAIRQGLTRVAAAGYARIGIAAFPHEMIEPTEHDLPAAICRVRHCDVDDLGTVSIYHGDPDDRLAFLRWFHQVEPDALLAIGKNARPWLQSDGIDVPRDVALAHVTPYEPSDNPGAGIHPDPRLLGEAAARLAVTLLAGQYGTFFDQPKAFVIDAPWTAGESLPLRGNSDGDRQKQGDDRKQKSRNRSCNAA